MVQPLQDYCNQIWSPVNIIGDLREQETPLKSFTKKISGLRHLDYWSRLKKLDLTSVERRSEHYKIFYIWKIIRGIVPNFGIKLSAPNPMFGTLVLLPPFKTSRGRASTRTLKEASLAIEGPKLFNSLPRELRDWAGSKDTFKKN